MDEHITFYTYFIINLFIKYFVVSIKAHSYDTSIYATALDGTGEKC